ncbi:MAG: hypothetical protein ACTS68_01650, partial [Candidatus Hodgkinia cicadicola]
MNPSRRLEHSSFEVNLWFEELFYPTNLIKPKSFEGEYFRTVQPSLMDSFSNGASVMLMKKATWNEETYLLTKLSSLSSDVRALSTTRTVVMIIGRSLLNF